MAPAKALDQYSTNPSTIKARRRKMKLDGADKVEDAAKTADYKAMVYARKVVQSKLEYKSANASERSDMLEKAMHETMEKRRARGQDTLSKMAAFRSGEYSLRTGTTGPSTNVPISRFLVSHGYIPNSTTRSASRGNEDAERIISPSTPESAGNSLDFSFNSPLMAPMADMDGSSDSIPQDFGKRESSAPVQSSHDRTINVNTPRRAQSHQHSKPVLSSHSPAPGVAFHAQRPMAPMTPATTSSGHEILPSIEQEGHDDEIAALRLEVAHMHNMFQDVIISKVNRNIADNQEHQDLPLNMVNDGTKVGNLEQRFDQMEAMMQNLHHRLLPKVMDRIEILEKVVKDLNFEARDGCASKVTKMKEVFDCLKEALIRMDNLL